MDNEKFTVEFGEVTNIGGGGTSDFDELTNRPKYNDTTMSSDTNIPKVPAKTSDLTNDGSDGDSTYVEADELAKVATSGSYADLENKPSIPTVNDATLTITQNGTSKGTFTANDADDTTIEVSDTTYSNFTGTDGTAAGAAGLVPAPATADADKFLKADGSWDTAGGGGPTVVQTTGTSTTDVMSQDATSKMIFADPGTDTKIKIGASATANGNNSISIGGGASTSNNGFRSVVIGGNAASDLQDSVAIGASASIAGSGGFAIAIGRSAAASKKGAIALGAWTNSGTVGVMNIGPSDTAYGYNSTNYRLLSGVHDPVDAHDAATKGYVDAHSGGGGGAIELTSADYNYDTNGGTNYNSIALWLLPDNLYKMPDSSVSMTGATNGTSYDKFNSAINGRHFQYFLKFGTRFWFFADGSNTIPEIGTGAMVYLCTLRTSDGRFSFDLNKQLATKGDLSA